MDVELTPDQAAFAREAIATGRIQDELDAIHEALHLWERRERTRLELLAKLHAAETSLARGDGLPITEPSMGELVQRVKMRGRARLAGEKAIERS